MSGSKYFKLYVSKEKTDPAQQYYILLPVSVGPSRAEKVCGIVVGVLFLIATLFVAWVALFSDPSPVKRPEDLRGGDANSQVIGNHLGGLDWPDVGVGEEKGAGELRP